MKFRMPLHPQQKREGFVPYAFHHAIGRACFDDQAGAELVHALMMNGVDAGAVRAGVNGLQPTTRNEFDLVGMLVVQRIIAMRVARDPGGVQVLMQRTAECHVDQLHAATDAQHGLVGLSETAQQLQFEPIAHRIDRAEQFTRLLAIHTRVDIGTALENQSIQRGNVIAGGNFPLADAAAALVQAVVVASQSTTSRSAS